MTLTKEILDLANRRRIYDYISKYPGLHQRELIKKLNLSEGTIRYHLKYLKKRGIIKTQSVDGYVRYYIINSIGNNQQKILHILRQEVPRNIILCLLIDSFASQIELSDSLEKHPTTIEFHLKKLLNMGIIEHAPVINGKVNIKFNVIEKIGCAPIGKEIFYKLKEPYFINDSIIRYKGKLFGDNYCDILPVFYRYFHSCSKLERAIMIKSNTKILSKNIVKSLEERFFEIFPHPYHV